MLTGEWLDGGADVRCLAGMAAPATPAIGEDCYGGGASRQRRWSPQRWLGRSGASRSEWRAPARSRRRRPAYFCDQKKSPQLEVVRTRQGRTMAPVGGGEDLHSRWKRTLMAAAMMNSGEQLERPGGAIVRFFRGKTKGVSWGLYGA